MKLLLGGALAAVAASWVVLAVPAGADEAPADVKRVPVTFTGGHDTDPQDRGRPVALIAAALGVDPEVFRAAFKQVRPAPAGERPDPRQVDQNKAALLSALGKHGVTNERLDEVSDYYRYRPGGNNLWKNRPAAAVALVKDRNIVGFEVTDGGAGYTSPPKVGIEGFRCPWTDVKLSFGTSLKKNGSIAAITIRPADTK